MKSLEPIRRRVAPLLALGLLVSGAGRAMASESVAWKRLDTPSFTFFSSAGDDVTRHYARELETFRRFVAGALGDGAVTSPMPTEVYLFGTSDTFEEFSLGENNVGWFTGTRQANVIALDTSSAAGTEVAYHEYAHFVVENSSPAVPLWLNEGLAEFYSTFRVDGSRLEVGRPLERHVEFLRRNRLIAFDDLFAVRRDSPEYTEERRRGVFYAQSWAFVHYLLVEQKDLHVEVRDFLGRLRDGEAADEAYEAAFGTSTIGLRRELEHYIGQAQFGYLTMRGERVAEKLAQPLPLSAAEAQARLGLLRLAGRVGDESQVVDALSTALAGEPRNATALRGMGELELRRRDYRQAAAWLDAALEADGSRVDILDLHGLALLQVVQSGLTAPGGLTPEERRLIERSRLSFARAIARAPSFAPALAGFGTTFFWDDDPSEGIAVSAEAVRLLPRNAVILSTHLALVAQAGEVEEARRIYRWLHRPAVRPSEENLADAERALFNAQFQHLIRTYHRPAEYAALLAGLESLADEAPDSQVLGELMVQIERLREVVDRNHWADTYNRALGLLRSGDVLRGRALLETVAAESNDAEIVGQAEEALGASFGSPERR